ncbi:MAG TPA: hypothetical protein PLL01_16495, partial [Rhodoferax sp.]|nr:hypothetical protein [Rhodoferax sp.]
MPTDLSVALARPYSPANKLAKLQKLRSGTQAGFFILFLLAPALNLLRFDLYETQLWFFGMRWTLGIDALTAGEISATQAGISILLRAFLPALVVVTGFLAAFNNPGSLPPLVAG